jgi:hypothetical protein
VTVALLLALGSQPARAACAPADSDLVHGYVYDAHVIPSVVTNGALERGPPANLTKCTSAPAVALRSYGRFTRPDDGTPAVGYTYDRTACRAQASERWGIGTEVAQGSYGELSALRLAGVAANVGTRSIDDLLSPGGLTIGKAGTDNTIREITGGLPDAQTMFQQLSQGSSIVAQTPKLTRVELPNGGGFVQLRTVMSRKSPNTVATIDVDIPGFDITKLKYNP